MLVKNKKKKKTKLPDGHTAKGIIFTYSEQTYTRRLQDLESFAAKIDAATYQLSTGELLIHQPEKEEVRVMIPCSAHPDFKTFLYNYMQRRKLTALSQYLTFYTELIKKLRLGIYSTENVFESRPETKARNEQYRRENPHVFNSLFGAKAVDVDFYDDL